MLKGKQRYLEVKPNVENLKKLEKESREIDRMLRKSIKNKKKMLTKQLLKTKNINRRSKKRNTLTLEAYHREYNYKFIEQERNTAAHSETGLWIQEKWGTFEQSFKIAVKEGPTNRCSCCERL